MLLISFFLLMNSSAWALEAMNPVSICNRMIHDADRKKCEEKATHLKLDWYAATACNALIEDKKVMTCWQEIAGADFNPEALDRCVQNPDDNDDSIYKCILSLKNNRSPASISKPYQSLKIKKGRR